MKVFWSWKHINCKVTYVRYHPSPVYKLFLSCDCYKYWILFLCYISIKQWTRHQVEIPCRPGQVGEEWSGKSCWPYQRTEMSSPPWTWRFISQPCLKNACTGMSKHAILSGSFWRQLLYSLSCFVLSKNNRPTFLKNNIMHLIVNCSRNSKKALKF